jgi:hypothetical protein
VSILIRIRDFARFGLGWRVDPDLRGQRQWLRRLVDKAFRMRRVSGVKGLLAKRADLLPALAMNHLRGQQPEPGMVMLGVVQVKKPRQKLRASCKDPNRSGNSGRYFTVLK